MGPLLCSCFPKAPRFRTVEHAVGIVVLSGMDSLQYVPALLGTCWSRRAGTVVGGGGPTLGQWVLFECISIVFWTLCKILLTNFVFDSATVYYRPDGLGVDF